MSEALTVTEAARHFADYVNRVAYRRESFILIRGNKPVAELRPLPTGKRLGDLPRLIAALPHLDDDDFGSDIDAARAELVRKGLVDPWQS
ncbi:MAG: type II toxin-antitoxin system Phd/YefM family antitoxin [Coriobacteriia bacterium]